MSYRIVARHSEGSKGLAKSTATEAMTALQELLGSGFEITAIVDDDGDNLPVEQLAELARRERA